MKLLDSFLESVSSQQTRRAYRTDLRSFFQREDLETSDPQSITSDDIKIFVRSMHQEGLAEATQRRRLAALRRFFDWLIERGTVSHNPARAPQVEPHPPTSGPPDPSLLSKDDVQHLLDTAGEADKTGPRDQALLLTIVYAALRRSEVATMTVEDVRPLGRHWVIDLQPGGAAKGGYVRIPDVVVEAIERVQSRYGIDEGALWRSLSNRNAGEPLSADGIYKIVRRVGHRADLGRVTVETLRQSGLYLALEADATMLQVQSHARLQSVRSVERLSTKGGERRQLMKNADNFIHFEI